MISRETYTTIFLKAADIAADALNIPIYSKKIWQNNRTKEYGGLRLSEWGYEFLTSKVQLQEYEVPFTTPIELSPQILISLDKFMDCPYYLTTQSVTVFSEKKAFELHIFSNDIRKYGLVQAMKVITPQQDLGDE